MKKRLEAELISIAHRVLKLKNKSEVDQLFIETQKLYEALSVLKFYGDHIDYIKPEIPLEELEEKLADSFDNKSDKSTATAEKETSLVEAPIPVEEEAEVTETKVVAVTHEPEEKSVTTETVPVDEESEVTETKEVAVDHEEEANEEPIIVGEIHLVDEDTEEEPVAHTIDSEQAEQTKEDIDSDPIFEMAAEQPAETKPNEPTKQISFEDFLGDNYGNLEFVKPNDTSKPKAEPSVTKTETKDEVKSEETEVLTEKKEVKNPILNEKLSTGINIGLNDRVGFVKYLFDNSSEDFNRVLSQLNTFDSYAEAKEFIDDMVKPDYNNWQGNEDFAERFMEIVEQKFK